MCLSPGTAFPTSIPEKRPPLSTLQLTLAFSGRRPVSLGQNASSPQYLSFFVAWSHAQRVPEPLALTRLCALQAWGGHFSPTSAAPAPSRTPAQTQSC